MVFNELWDILLTAQEEILKKTIRCRVGERGGERVIESEWVTEEIRQGIAERRRLKRLERNSTGEEKARWKREWEAQKAKVQVMVRDTKREWEEVMAKKVRECKDGGKKLWDLINKLRGKTRSAKVDEFYEDGKRIEIEEGWDEFIDIWLGIYQMRLDNILDRWEGGWGEGLKEISESQHFLKQGKIDL